MRITPSDRPLNYSRLGREADRLLRGCAAAGLGTVPGPLSGPSLVAPVPSAASLPGADDDGPSAVMATQNGAALVIAET